MLMKAVGKDSTSLFSILCWSLCDFAFVFPTVDKKIIRKMADFFFSDWFFSYSKTIVNLIQALGSLGTSLCMTI